MLGVGNHFGSWRGHVELSHLVGLPGKRTDPFCGSQFGFQFKRRNFFICICICICVSFAMSLSVLPTALQLVSMTSIADVRGHAELASTVWNAAPASWRKCHCSVILWVGNTGALSTIVAKSSDPSVGCSRTRAVTSPAHFSRGCSTCNHVGRVEAGS